MHELLHTQQMEQHKGFLAQYLWDSAKKLFPGGESPVFDNKFEDAGYDLQRLMTKAIKGAYGERGPCPDACE